LEGFLGEGVFLAQLAGLFIEAGQMLPVCVCLYANQGATNGNRVLLTNEKLYSVT